LLGFENGELYHVYRRRIREMEKSFIHHSRVGFAVHQYGHDFCTRSPSYVDVLRLGQILAVFVAFAGLSAEKIDKKLDRLAPRVHAQIHNHDERIEEMCDCVNPRGDIDTNDIIEAAKERGKTL
jgi:hypothetical protein